MVTGAGLLVGLVTYATLLRTRLVLLIDLVLLHTPVSRIPRGGLLVDDPQWVVTFSNLYLLFPPRALADCRRTVLEGSARLHELA